MDIAKYLTKLNLKFYSCNRCNHSWLSKRRTTDFVPKWCPNCKSPYWNKKRKNKLKKK